MILYYKYMAEKDNNYLPTVIQSIWQKKLIYVSCRVWRISDGKCRGRKLYNVI